MIRIRERKRVGLENDFLPSFFFLASLLSFNMTRPEGRSGGLALVEQAIHRELRKG